MNLTKKVSHLAGSESHLAAAPRATPDVAVVADVADAVGELGLEANLASRLHLHSGFPLKFRFLLDLHLQLNHLLLLDPEKEIEKEN